MRRKMNGGGQAPDLNQMVEQVAKAVQDGQDISQIVMQLLQNQISPEQVVEIVSNAGVPSDQVQQILQSIMQQQAGAQNQDPNQNPVMAFGGAFDNEFKKNLKSKLELPDDSSENYVNERFKLFQEAVRRNVAHVAISGGYNKSSVKAADGIDFKRIQDDLGITKEMYDSNLDYKNRVDDYWLKIKPASTTTFSSQNNTSNSFTEEELFNRFKDYMTNGTFYEKTGQNSQMSGYADPRQRVPVSPFGRVIIDSFSENPQMKLVNTKFQGVPDTLDIESLLKGTNPNYSISNVETFKKGLFGRRVGVRLNLTTSGQNGNVGLTSNANTEGKTLYNGTWYDTPEEAIQAKELRELWNQAPTNNPDPSSIDWNQTLEFLNKIKTAADGIDLTYRPSLNSADVADTLLNTANNVAHFINLSKNYDKAREDAFFSTANVAPVNYDNMSRGLYDQQGNFIPDKVDNQVLNPTNSFSEEATLSYMADGGDLLGTPDEQMSEYKMSMEQLKSPHNTKQILSKSEFPELYNDSATGLKVKNVYKSSAGNGYFYEYEAPSAHAPEAKTSPNANTPATKIGYYLDPHTSAPLPIEEYGSPGTADKQLMQYLDKVAVREAYRKSQMQNAYASQVAVVKANGGNVSFTDDELKELKRLGIKIN